MKYEELEMVFDAATIFDISERYAYISKQTQELVYENETYTGVPCPVEDIESNDNYIPVPNRNDLDLGQKLVWEFVEKEIPEKEDQVNQIFQKKGAYGRYREFLHQLKLLEKWYAFEAERKQEALRDWCKDNHIELSD